MQRSHETPGAATWRGPAGFFAATLGLLLVFRVHAEVNLDTARDLLIARDCTLGVHCSEAGPRSSFVALMHGALWSHVLELREAWGLGIAAIEVLVVVALAAAAALVPVSARLLGRRAGPVTWALWLPAALVTSGYPTLWNPSLWPLALAVFTAALAYASRRRGLVWFVGAAAGLALGIELHVSTAVLLPFLVAVIAACARRPLVTTAIAGAASWGILALDSPKGFVENREVAAQHATALALTLAAAFAAGLAARRRLGARADAERAAVVAAALCVYWMIALVLLAGWSGHGLRARYLAPLATPAAILLGARIEGPRIRRVAVLVVVAWHLASWAGARLFERRRFDVVEAEVIARELYGRDLAFGDLYRGVRGPHAEDLVATLAAFEPPDGRRAREDGPGLRIVRAGRGDVPAGAPSTWRVLELGGGAVAVIVALDAWVRLDPLEICEDGRCEAVSVDVARFDQREGMVWADRAYASFRARGMGAGTPGARSYRMQLRPSGAGRREIRLVPDDCAQWWIVDVDGSPPEDDRRTIVDASARAITFGVDPGRRCRGWLPPFVEIDPAEPALADPSAS